MTPEEIEHAAQSAAARIRQYWWLIEPMISGDYARAQPTLNETKTILCRAIDLVRDRL